MYYFNTLLFKNLSSLFEMTQKSFSQKVFNTDHTYMRKASNEHRILVSDLVLVCNKMRISISHFITLDPNFSYRGRSIEYVIDSRLFKPILFDSSSLNKMYGKAGLAGSITKEDFAKRMGVSSPALYLWINKERCTIKLYQLLDMCNKFGVNIGEFINDPNSPLPLNDVPIAPLSPMSVRSSEELIELRKIVSNDQKVISNLRRELESMHLSDRGYQVAEEQQMYASEVPSVRSWHFNKELLAALPGLYLTSKDEMLKSLGMSNPTVSYDKGNITVQLLIEICNKYRISSKHFFIRQTESAGVIREQSFYRTENFSPIQFHPEYISDIFGRNSLTDMTLEDVLTILGYSEIKIRGWRNAEKSTLRVNDMAELCSALLVTPSCFITDINRTSVIYSSTQVEYFLEENRLLRQEKIRLNETIKKWKK